MKISLLFLSVLIFAAGHSFGQGCSDAGFCTLNTFQPESIDSAKQRDQLNIGLSFGKADHAIHVWGTYFEYVKPIGKRFQVDLRLTTLAQYGNDISMVGLSDVFVSSSYSYIKNSKFTLGFKIPLSNGNKMENGLPLPMDYQSSLGTFDLVTGISYEIHRLQLAAALQWPLIQNANTFTAELYPEGDIIRTFQSTNQYIRRGDVLLRASLPINFGKRFSVTPSLLPIYHLNNDRYTDLNGVERSIEGSQGLTLNGNLFFDVALNSMNKIRFTVAKPFITRSARPDGLTRSYLVQLEYKISF